jgi:hypothetical protein
MPKFRWPPLHLHNFTAATLIKTGVHGMESEYQYYPAPIFAASRLMVLMVAVFRASRTSQIWLAGSSKLQRSAPPSMATAALLRHGSWINSIGASSATKWQVRNGNSHHSKAPIAPVICLCRGLPRRKAKLPGARRRTSPQSRSASTAFSRFERHQEPHHCNSNQGRNAQGMGDGSGQKRVYRHGAISAEDVVLETCGIQHTSRCIGRRRSSALYRSKD